MSYWRTADDVLKFAAGPTHKETWAWWDAHAPELKHIGISHEIFQADRGMYENVYHNFQPTRLGATSFFRQGDKMIGGTVADSWISPLVSASRGKLRSARGRMNITQGDESEKYGYAPESAEVWEWRARLSTVVSPKWGSFLLLLFIDGVGISIGLGCGCTTWSCY